MLNDTDFVKYVAETYSYLVAEAVRKLEGMSVEQYLALVKKHYGDGVIGDLLAALSEDLQFTKKFVLNEHHLYGSSRLGVKTHKRVLLRKEFSISGFEPSTGSGQGGEYIVDEVTDSLVYVASSEYFCRVLAQKQYEMSNHLGNVLATVLDRRTGVFDETEDTLMYYVADVVNAKVYYPFGSSMMSYSNIEFAYSYGMNTQEKDDEIYGKGNSYSAEYWQYDARLGRRWNNDPRPNPSISVYACFMNNPILKNDIVGDTVFLNLSSYNSYGITPLNNSKVVSKYIKQFGSANGGAFTNSKSQYGNVINLNLTSVLPGSIAHRNMVINQNDVQTTFMYSLSDGSTVAANLYTPTPGINVTGISINMNILSGVFNNLESFGNNRTTAAIATSQVVTKELYSTVVNFMNLLQANTNPDGSINFIGLSNAYAAFLAGGSAAPSDPALPGVLLDVSTSTGSKSGLFYQYDTYDDGSGSVIGTSVITFSEAFNDNSYNIHSGTNVNPCGGNITQPASDNSTPATICVPTPDPARTPLR